MLSTTPPTTTQDLTLTQSIVTKEQPVLSFDATITQENEEVPEGPEIRRIADELEQLIAILWIVDLKPIGKSIDKPIVGLTDALRLLPRQVNSVNVKGKFMWWDLSKNDSALFFMIGHGMTGRWTTLQTQHSLLRVSVANSAEKFKHLDLFFDDRRKFGSLKFVTDAKTLQLKLKDLGPDLLANYPPDASTITEFVRRIRLKKNATLAEALLDQRTAAGIGNYVKCEALYLSALSPHRKVTDVSDYDLGLLCTSAAWVMDTSYKLGGATLSVDDSDTGMKRFIVYGQKFDPTGNEIVRETTRDNRTTYWCPQIQS